MDLKAIINRPMNSPINQDECLFVIREYIKERKNLVIRPVINLSPFIEQDLRLMVSMANTAIAWFKENTNT